MSQVAQVRLDLPMDQRLQGGGPVSLKRSRADPHQQFAPGHYDSHSHQPNYNLAHEGCADNRHHQSYGPPYPHQERHERVPQHYAMGEPTSPTERRTWSYSHGLSSVPQQARRPIQPTQAGLPDNMRPAAVPISGYEPPTIASNQVRLVTPITDSLRRHGQKHLESFIPQS